MVIGRYFTLERELAVHEWGHECTNMDMHSIIRGENSWTVVEFIETWLYVFPLVAEEVKSAAMEEFRKRK